jgi:NADH-quinone oxidoreductase subunit C
MSDEETKAPLDGEERPQEGDAAPSAEDEAAKAEAAAKARAEAAEKARLAKQAAEAAKPVWERDPQPPQWAEVEGDAMVEALRRAHGEGLQAARTIGDELVLTAARESVRDIARSLHDEHGFRMLIDICGVDRGEDAEGPRFEVVYHLLSLDGARRVRLRTAVGDGEQVPSVMPVWRGANWPEREVFDMYGVRFADHPDMTSILMWEGFHGHPLRKDFPVEGIDTGSAIYPEYYEESAGPVIGTGTGWKPPKEEEPAEGSAED